MSLYLDCKGNILEIQVNLTVHRLRFMVLRIILFYNTKKKE